MWNKKRKNVLLITEILVSFIVLFVILSFVVYTYKNYEGGKGFSSENIRIVNLKMGSDGNGFSDSIAPYHQSINEVLKGYKEIKTISYSDFAVPYILGSHTENAKYKNASTVCTLFFKDDSFDKAVDLKLVSGRWFNNTDEDSTRNTLVLSERIKEKLFGNEDPINKYVHGIGGENNKWKVVGVVKDVKFSSDYLPATDAIFLRMDKHAVAASNTIFLKVTENAGADFENSLSKSLSGILKNANIEISVLDNDKKSKNRIVLIPALIFIIICSFLILNVCLGLFGVLWYNINKRKSEIGLRKALGATSRSVMFHFVGEVWVLATFALTIGLFFAIQFPLLHVLDLPSIIYIKAIIYSIFFIYFIVSLCAIYPSGQASSVFPAEVLHEE